MTQEIEEELKEDDAIHPIDDEPGSPKEPPLTSGHLPFDETEITPLPEDRVMDMCNVTFNYLKKRIVQQR